MVLNAHSLLPSIQIYREGGGREVREGEMSMPEAFSPDH